MTVGAMFGKDVAPHRPPRRRARSASGQDVVVGEHARDLAAHDAGEHHAEADPDRQRHRPDRAFQGGDEHECEDQGRQRDQDVDRMRQPFAHPARRDRAQHSECEADQGGDQHRGSGDEQCGPGADEHLREQVLAATIGAEPVRPTRSAATGRPDRPAWGRRASRRVTRAQPAPRRRRARRRSDPTTSATHISLRHVPVRRRGSTTRWSTSTKKPITSTMTAINKTVPWTFSRSREPTSLTSI